MYQKSRRPQIRLPLAQKSIPGQSRGANCPILRYQIKNPIFSGSIIHRKDFVSFVEIAYFSADEPPGGQKMSVLGCREMTSLAIF